MLPTEVISHSEQVSRWPSTTQSVSGEDPCHTSQKSGSSCFRSFRPQKSPYHPFLPGRRQRSAQQLNSHSGSSVPTELWFCAQRCVHPSVAPLPTLGLSWWLSKTLRRNHGPSSNIALSQSQPELPFPVGLCDSRRWLIAATPPVLPPLHPFYRHQIKEPF